MSCGLNLRKHDMSILEIIGQWSSIKAKFNALLPTAKPIAEERFGLKSKG